MNFKRMGERLAALMHAGAQVILGGIVAEKSGIRGVYRVECVGPREECRAQYIEMRDEAEQLEREATRPFAAAFMNVHAALAKVRVLRAQMTGMLEPKWADEFSNLVVTVGKNYILDNALAGSSYTATMYHGLVDGGSSPTYAAGDTMASHSGWTESAAYSNSTRVAASWSSAAAGSKALSAASAFNINATATIAGAFMTNVSTKSGTTGTLVSAGSFSGGNKGVANGDQLNVSYSLAL